MITEWIVTVALGIAQWFGTLFPTFDLPDWFTNLGSSINGLFANVQGFAPFVDWGAIAAIAAVPMALWAGGLLFKLARFVLSHVPFFGGK